MPQYKYQVREAGGGVTGGTVAAASLAEAAGMVRSQGGELLDISPAGRAAQGLVDRVRNFRIDLGPGMKDVLNFTSELSVMIKAGISVRDAVAGIAEQADKPKFRSIVEQIREDVESGKPFSEALARHPKVFNPLYVNMVRASEMSGSFGHMLERISGYLRQQLETRSMVRGAMIYPAIIGVMAVATTIFLLTFVLPRFSTIFAGKEAVLPAPTRILLAISAFIRHYWYVVVGALAGLGAGFYYFINTPVGRTWWDAAKLRLPLFRRMFCALYITRGLQTMGEMVNAGVPMLDTLRITADVSGNTLYRRMWMAVFRSVKGGKKIAAPLARGRLLPRSVVQMVSAGEESGKLSEVLADVATHYAQELRNTIKAVTAMIEPLMIVAMGLVVGFIAMSIILPIFKLSQLVK
jgi:type IV pilus assembly protein PilC